MDTGHTGELETESIMTAYRNLPKGHPLRKQISDLLLKNMNNNSTPLVDDGLDFFPYKQYTVDELKGQFFPFVRAHNAHNAHDTKVHSTSKSIHSYVNNGKTYSNVKTESKTNVNGKLASKGRELYRVGNETYEKVYNPDGTVQTRGNPDVVNMYSNHPQYPQYLPKLNNYNSNSNTKTSKYYLHK